MTPDLQIWDGLMAALTLLAQGRHSVRGTEGARDGTKIGIIWIRGPESNKNFWNC